MNSDLKERIKETADFLRSRGIAQPEVGIVLGSGLNDFADRIKDAICIPYGDIPNFTAGKADSHRGILISGEYKGKNVLALAGRYHYYESADMNAAAFPARVLVELGIKRLIITNAAGCINTDFRAGQLMLISDHINLTGMNPLMGPNLDEYGPRFPDMTYTYNKELRDVLKVRAAEEGIDLAEGVYCMFCGPSFETPAEIRMARVFGADAAGMSSVPEAVIANHAGKEIIGISFLSNMAAGVLDQPLSGEEVTENSKKVQKDFARVLDLAIEI